MRSSYLYFRAHVSAAPVKEGAGVNLANDLRISALTRARAC